MANDHEAEYEALKAAREMAAKETRVALDRVARAMIRDEQRNAEPKHEGAGSHASQ
jgi:hypothetical protein